ncbi:putative Cell wall glucanase [Seiridium cardinale]
MRVTSLSFAVVSLLQLSAAEPRQRAFHQRHAHRRAFIPKRDRLTITDPTFASPTEIPEIVVYVDQFGNPVRTATETVLYVPTATSSTASESTSWSTSWSSASPAATSVAPVAPTGKPAAPETAAPAVEVTPSTTPSGETIPTSVQDPVATKPEPTSSAAPASPTSATGGSSSNLHGVTYSPYKGTGGCKSASEVDADFAVFGSDHGVIRLYGVDCDQVASAYAAAKKYGNKLFLGIFDINSVRSAVSTMAAGVNNDWSIVDTVSVGNELVNNGVKSPAQVIAAVKEAREALGGAGYQGPVVTVDTFVAAINHPELCDESDYCAVNVHPFFDPNTGADQAGSFVTTQIERIRAKLANPSKRIVVTETGWPWDGHPNGAAVPGKDNQAQAISSIKSSFSGNPADCILFTAFNDMWKKPAAGTFYAEQFWVIATLRTTIRNIDTNMPSDKKEKTSPKPPPPKEKPPPAPRPGFAKLHDPKPPPQLPPK